MGVKVTQWIPAAKLGQFHQVLCATNGRYLSDPVVIGERVLVHYESGDYELHETEWARCITPIKEVRSDDWWRCVLRRTQAVLRRTFAWR